MIPFDKVKSFRYGHTFDRWHWRLLKKQRGSLRELGF